jgi:hypothetical protein
MASIKFIDKPSFYARFMKASFSVTKIRESNSFRSKVEHDLPFRIKFSSVGVPGYGPPGFPGIGIQVIGYNNYIL